MAGGGGGGDGGAQKMEEQRQARVQSAINTINAIFNGEDRVVPTSAATSYDPNATYYNADGTQWSAPKKAVQVDMTKVYDPATGQTQTKQPNYMNYGSTEGGWYEHQMDPALGRWEGGGDAGERWVPNPGLDVQYGADGSNLEGVFRTVLTPDMDAVNKRIAAGDLYSGTQTIKGINRKGLYDEQRAAVTDLNRRDVDRQFLDAERANRFGLARAGLSGGSADIDSNAELGRRTNEGLIKAAGLGDQAAADLQTSDERTRQNLISMAQSGIDTGQAAQMAMSQLDANSSNAASARSGATIGSLFGDLSQAYLYGQQQQGARTGAAPYQQWQPGSIRSGGSSGSVV
ncbi:hypothetical protein C4E15_06770 [Achromobacter spanius]|uniref:Uncharacterized protein n=1 Tax=Achromobacter spanius TaxID=217203 RepID=A0A2S5GUH5_9BURK|nr:hypothetical protein [Achromobacter spanius]PPA76491.1 hypothetical protein C4E15_06770 [Achromobacter spanius]